jgi:hypothetical protein
MRVEEINHWAKHRMVENSEKRMNTHESDGKKRM